MSGGGSVLTRGAMGRTHGGFAVFLWLLPAQNSHQAGDESGVLPFAGAFFKNMTVHFQSTKRKPGLRHSWSRALAQRTLFWPHFYHLPLPERLWFTVDYCSFGDAGRGSTGKVASGRIRPCPRNPSIRRLRVEVCWGTEGCGCGFHCICVWLPSPTRWSLWLQPTAPRLRTGVSWAGIGGTFLQGFSLGVSGCPWQGFHLAFGKK